MKAISFSFTPESSESARSQVLETIRSWTEVAAADLIKADAKNPVVRRLGTILLEAEDKLGPVLSKLREVPEVAQASEPPTRTLIQPEGGTSKAP
jgi:hypothetical protein